MNNLNLLKVYNFDKKKRLGNNGDGGYVIAELDEPESHPKETYDCYISAGVSDEESFSRDFINKYQLDKDNCYAFDGTINDYPWRYTNNINFIKKNIGPINDQWNDNLSTLFERYSNIFLKIDIEGGEYPWLLNDSLKLNNFKQIVIEFHGITNHGWGTNYADKVKCLEKLNDTHYIVHAHGNNHAHVTCLIPDVIELTYVNKNYFSLVPELNKTPLPIPGIDYPNHHNRRDIDLNIFPFVN